MAERGGAGVADILLPARRRLGRRGSAALLFTLAVPFIWIFTMSMTLAAPSSFPYADQAVFSLALGTALLVQGLRSRGAAGQGREREGLRAGTGGPLAADVCCGAVLALAAAALPLGVGGARLSPARVALLVAAGAAFAWLALRCFRLTCLVGREGAASAVLVPFALAALVRLAFSAVPEGLSLVTVACLAASGPLALWGVRALGRRLAADGGDGGAARQSRTGSAATGAAGGGTSVQAGRGRPVSLGAFLAETGLCALVLGFFKGGVGLAWGGVESAVNYLARAGVALAILLVFTGRGSGRGPSRAVRTAISAALLTLLAASLLGGEQASAGVSRALFSLSRNFALVVVYLMALGLAHRDGWAPDGALGVLRGAFELEQGVGVAAAAALGAAASALYTPRVTFIVTAFVVLVVFDLLYQLLAEGGLVPGGGQGVGAGSAGGPGGVGGSEGGFSFPAAARPVPGASVLAGARPVAGLAAFAISSQELDERCAYLGWLDKLTARETEVARLSCDGLSKAEMAAKLGVSVNTVRWHAQNAYAKLGVHNVSELLALLARTTVPEGFKGAEPYLGRRG